MKPAPTAKPFRLAKPPSACALPPAFGILATPWLVVKYTESASTASALTLLLRFDTSTAGLPLAVWQAPSASEQLPCMQFWTCDRQFWHASPDMPQPRIQAWL